MIHALGEAASSYGYTPRLVPWLKERKGEFDIVVSHGLWQFNGFAVRQALEDSATPFCVFPHGMLDPWFKRHYPLKHFKKWLYWTLIERAVLRDAAGVLFTCEEERLLARETFRSYQCREVVTGLGIAAPPADSLRQKELFLERFPGLAGRRLLLFLGRLHEKKGCRELLEAFRTVVVRENADVHLVMAGPTDNPYASELQEWSKREGLSGRVTWTGMLSGALKWGAFYSAEAFVLPSHQENFGIAVAEAMACGVPVLISNKVNIWREIEQDGAGLIEDDGPAGTDRLLHRWLQMQPEARTAMGQSAAASFRQRFEISKAATDLLSVFGKLIAEKRRTTSADTPSPVEGARAVIANPPGDERA